MTAPVTDTGDLLAAQREIYERALDAVGAGVAGVAGAHRTLSAERDRARSIVEAAAAKVGDAMAERDEAITTAVGLGISTAVIAAKAAMSTSTVGTIAKRVNDTPPDAPVS